MLRSQIRSPNLANRLQTLFDCVPYSTDYERMHASKPNPAYYLEIATLIGCAPADCVMIGNEVQNDILPAKRAGMKTFWVTGAGEFPTDVPADWRGTLQDFGVLLESGEF